VVWSFLYLAVRRVLELILLCFRSAEANEILTRWAMRKYKRLRYYRRRARRFLADIARREPTLFAHWRLGAWP
jgi:hypothetical protein